MIGAIYGTLTDDLPPAIEVIALYNTNGIGKMRIFYTNQATHQALKGSNIEVIVGVVNDDLQGLASSLAAANTWVQTNIIPYVPDVKISYISISISLSLLFKRKYQFPSVKININFHFIVFCNQISTLQTYYFLTKPVSLHSFPR